jgi:hypothetical protein
MLTASPLCPVGQGGNRYSARAWPKPFFSYDIGINGTRFVLDQTAKVKTLAAGKDGGGDFMGFVVARTKNTWREDPPVFSKGR